MGASFTSPSSASLAETQGSNWSFSGATFSPMCSLLVTRQGEQGRINWVLDRIGSHSINPQNNALRSNFMNRRVSFTPKILSGINAQNILLGQESHDSFSPNCWLENRLHMFGRLDLNQDANVDPPARESQEGSPLYNEREASEGNSYELSSSTVSSRDRSLFTNSLSRSTISDVTRFYSTRNLSGSAFDPEDPFPEPPPYSELPDDPPPPYTESLVSPDNSQHNSQPERGHVCNPVFTASRISCSDSDILW